MTLQEKIKKAMYEKGWSQSDLLYYIRTHYKNVAISSSSISLYLSGKRNPSNATLKVLAESLGVPAAYLAGYTDSIEEGASNFYENLMHDEEMLSLNIEETGTKEIQNTQTTNFDVMVIKELGEILDYTQKMAQLPKEKRTLIFNMIDNLI